MERNLGGTLSKARRGHDAGAYAGPHKSGEAHPEIGRRHGGGPPIGSTILALPRTR